MAPLWATGSATLTPWMLSTPCRLSGGKQAPPGASPAHGGLGQGAGCKHQSWAAAHCRPWCAQRGSGASPKQDPGPAPKCHPAEGITGLQAQPHPRPCTAPQGCPSIHPSLSPPSPETQGREPRLSPAPRAGSGLGAARSQRLGHRTCWGSSAMPGTTAEPQEPQLLSFHPRKTTG